MASLLTQCLLGIQCNDFAMLAVDQTALQNVIIIKDDENKLYEITEHLVMGVNGESSDINQIVNFVVRNMKLYEMRNGYTLHPTAVVNFVRKTVSDSIREEASYTVNYLFAGYCPKTGGQLYYLDSLGYCMMVPFGGHGLGGMMCMEMINSVYRPDLSQTEAYQILKNCCKEIQKRFFLNFSHFQVGVVDEYGIQDLPTITRFS